MHTGPQGGTVPGSISHPNLLPHCTVQAFSWCLGGQPLKFCKQVQFRASLDPAVLQLIKWRAVW